MTWSNDDVSSVRSSNIHLICDVHWFHLIPRCSVQSVKIAMATRVSSFTTGLVSCMHLIWICQINILQPEMSRFLINSCVEAPTQITRVFFMHEIWWVKIDFGKGLVNDICESWIIKITLTRISTARMSRPTRINQAYSCSGIQSSDLSYRGLKELTMNIYTTHLWWSMGLSTGLSLFYNVDQFKIYV